ncbi:membrane protein, partial [Streptomyces sp. NRRL WC-3753]
IGTIAFTSIARRRRLLMTQTPPVVEGGRTHDDRLL